jgi:Mn2+/Fe2+ NRAMP family transporter
MSEQIRHSLGPAIIIAAAVVGTGEMIVAPRLGAAVGLSALWLIILGCVVKVFVQEELGRHTILTGDTMLEALNRVPGPAWRVSWATWSWLLLLFAGTLQMGGILVSLVQTLQLSRLQAHALVLALIVTFGTAAVLIAGRYKFIERASGLMVAGFTAMTVIALALLQRTEFSVSVAQILDGLKFKMPEHGFADAVAVFGITGIGTAELIFYPYWCLEKGYAKDFQAGVPRERSLVAARIRGMRVDISIALVVYTFATLAFFILGATILHGVQEIPKGVDMIQTLSQMYTRTFGQWVYYVFVAGAAVVLYSTFFVAMATWSRLIADTVRLVSKRETLFDHRRVTNRAIAALGLVYIGLFLVFKQTPQWLIVGGGAIQTLLLPLFSIAVLFIRRRRPDEFRPGRWHDLALYLSVAVITSAAAYALWGLLPKR